MPLNFVLFSGEFLKMVLKLSSLISSHCAVVKFSISGMGAKAGSLWGFENLFQGQISWQISHPNIQLLNLPFILLGIRASFSSMVK